LVHPAIAANFGDLAVGPPNCVVLGDAREGFAYAALNQVFRMVQRGMPLVGIGRNRYVREGGQLLLDAGALHQAIEWAAGMEAVVIGKPAAPFFQELVRSAGLPPQQYLMVGDDIKADVIGAMAAGLAGCLVQTGKDLSSERDRLPGEARLIPSIADLSALLGWH